MKKNLWTWLLHDKKRRKNAMCMKICLCLALVLGGGVFSNTFAQSEKLTLKRENASMLDIILAVERQSKMTFVYSMDAVNKIGKITIDVKDVLIDSVMNICLGKTDYTYSLEKNVVVIKKRSAEEKAMASAGQVKRKLLTGTVCDNAKVTLPGVSVYIKGTTVGVVTDIDGKYKIEVPENVCKLIFSFVGMQTKEIEVGKETVINVVMQEEVSDLDEVTVIAYGERNKKELISSVSSVKAKDLEEVPSSSLENLLQGHMAGVEVNNVSAAPGGGGSRIAIRGYNTLMIDGISDNTPLYVVDGVPIQSFTSPLTGTNTLAEIDPMTIESVEVLKDAASAAIYGSRASNGVILITTKKGKAGQATFSANASYTWGWITETPVQIQGNGERKWWLYAARYAIYGYTDTKTGMIKMPASMEESLGTDGMYDYWWKNGQIGIGANVPLNPQLQDSLNPFYNNSTNWWKYTYKTGKTLNANLQASGGTERVKYMVGAGWYDEEGINVGSGFSRFNMLTNLNFIPRKNLTMDSRLSLSYSDMSMSGGGLGSRKLAYMTVSPTGTSTLLSDNGAAYDQMFKYINDVSEKKYNFNIRASLRLAYQVISGLDLSASVSGDYHQSQVNRFEPSYLDPKHGLSKSEGRSEGSMYFQTEELLHYNFSLKEQHNFDWLFGFSYTRQSSNSLKGEGKGSPSDYIHYVVDGMPSLKDIDERTQAMQSFGSSFKEQKMISCFGRLAYNFRQKYLTEITVRRDGSSVFGKDVRWATFPSVAVGWNFSDESFMKNFWWLNHGKIRASWGQSGNTFQDPYLAQGVIDVGSSFLGVTGLMPSQMENKHLTWEKSDQYDLGLDVDVLNYRLKFKLDYYYKYTKSMLWQVTLPGTVYFHSSMWDNAIEVSNEGLELEAQFDILRETAVKWRMRFNVSRNWNRLEKTYTGVDIDGKYVIGRSANELQVYRDLGYVQNANEVPITWDQKGNPRLLGSGGMAMPTREGMRMIADLNGDGVISDKDLYFAGSTLPKAYGGFAGELKWKGFDLNFLFSYSLGRHIINAFRKSALNFDPVSLKAVFEDYRNVTFWEKTGDQSDYPVMSSVYYYYQGQFDGQVDSNIETVNFLRLKQLTIGYNLPTEWARKCYLQGVRVFFTGENMFLWSNYSGLDPENVDVMTGIDNMSYYPSARKVTIGLSVKF